MSNRGLLLPTLNIPIWLTLALALLLVSLILGIVLIRRKTTLLRGFLIWVSSAVVVFMLASLIMTPVGESSISIPELKGLRYRDGLTISVELVAMIVAIVLYGSTYIAEVVRGGLERVPVNLVEAGKLELIGILMGCFLLVNFSLAQFVNWLNRHMALKAH